MEIKKKPFFHETKINNQIDKNKRGKTSPLQTTLRRINSLGAMLPRASIVTFEIGCSGGWQGWFSIEPSSTVFSLKFEYSIEIATKSTRNWLTVTVADAD